MHTLVDHIRESLCSTWNLASFPRIWIYNFIFRLLLPLWPQNGMNLNLTIWMYVLFCAWAWAWAWCIGVYVRSRCSVPDHHHRVYAASKNWAIFILLSFELWRGITKAGCHPKNLAVICCVFLCYATLWPVCLYLLHEIPIWLWTRFSFQLFVCLPFYFRLHLSFAFNWYWNLLQPVEMPRHYASEDAFEMVHCIVY